MLRRHHRSLKQTTVVSSLILSLLHLTSLADPVLDKADTLIKSGQVNAASAIYTEYLRLHPQSTSAKLALGQIAIQRSDFAKARQILENALSQNPRSTEVAATLGRLFQLWTNASNGKASDNSRDYMALAKEHLTQALSMGPTNPLALTYMAEWQIQQNNLTDAERNINAALQQDPNFVPAFQAQVRFYMKAKDLSRAKDAALHALELEPQNSTSLYLTAQLLALASHPAEAVKYTERSEQLDYGRSTERDYFLANQYEKLGNLPKATQYYLKMALVTPKDANIWMKLGELYEAQQQPAQSQQAYQAALQLDPQILSSLYMQARENTRNEKIALALKQWRKILTLQGSQPDAVQEAWSQIANLHTINHFLHPEQTSAEAAQDATTINPNSPTLQLDRLKILLSQGKLMQAELTALTKSNDAGVAGEAAFLLQDYAQARENLSAVDGLSAEEYTFWADRLFADQALSFAQVFYQRAYELNLDPSLQAVVRRIQAKQTLANQKLNEGNGIFQTKDYVTAANKYLEAIKLYPEADNAYLRLGDAYEQLKNWPEAKRAYDTAISLSPSLMDSKGFAKNYQKLSARINKK